MKLTSIFLLAACLQVSAKGLSQTVSFSGKEVPLRKVMASVEKQTGYVFIIESNLLAKAKPVTLSVKNLPVEEFMKVLLKDQPMEYTIESKTIVISPRENTANAMLNEPLPINISGRVTNENGEPVEGVSILVKGTQQGTTTNADGYFEMQHVDENAMLVITGANIERSEVKVSVVMTISVKTAVKPLEEFVYKGYYSERRLTSTGSVSKVSSKEIEKQPISNPLQAIQGRMAGVYIQQESGMPGSGFTVQIRGRNSIQSGNDPLYVIDGVPFPGTSLHMGEIGNPNGNIHPLNNINPADIESMEVLKDADATAIYGSRGANGVILITTKKGKAGKTSVELNAYTGIGKVARMMDLLNTKQYLQMRREAFINDGRTPGPEDYDVNGTWDTTRYTDWQKELLGGTATMTNAQLSFSGGNATTQFKAGGGYQTESTVFPGESINRKISTHLAITHRSADQKLNAVFSSSFLVDKNNLLGFDLTGNTLGLPPVAPAIYNQNGDLNWENSTWDNPFASLFRKYKSTTKNLVINGTLGYNILPALQLKTSIGYNTIAMNEISTAPKNSFRPSYGLTSGGAQFGNNSRESWIIEPQVFFNKDWGHSKLSILAGASFQESRSDNEAMGAGNFTSDALLENIKAAGLVNIFSATTTVYRYNAFFGRLNYDYKGKYIANLTARRDGSSRFGPGKQFANFGAVGLAWIFSKEQFIQDKLGWLSFGKLRGSYGTTGNDQIGDYGFLDTYSPSVIYQGLRGIEPTRLYNTDFGWELTKKLEMALELGLLNDRILLAAGYYINRSSSQLIYYALPPNTGFSYIIDNFPATVQNTGLELELTTVNLKSKNISWRMGLNATFPKNKLVAFPGLETSPYANRYAIGKPLSIRNTFTYQGVDPATGVYSFEDVDGNGSLDNADRAMSKAVTQNLYGGIQNSLNFKNWQLDILFQFVKQTGDNYQTMFYYPPGAAYNQPVYVMERWQKPGDVANAQKFTQDYGDAYMSWVNHTYVSDNVIVDASFIRLKNLSLSYNLPAEWMKNAKLQYCRVYLQCQNLLTITGYKGLGPEFPGSANLPPLKVLTAGIQVIL